MYAVLVQSSSVYSALGVVNFSNGLRFGTKEEADKLALKMAAQCTNSSYFVVKTVSAAKKVPTPTYHLVSIDD